MNIKKEEVKVLPEWMAEAIGNVDKQIPVDCREKMMVVLIVDNVDCSSV